MYHFKQDSIPQIPPRKPSMPKERRAPEKMRLCHGEQTKVLWKPLLTQNPAMGCLECPA